MLLEVAVDLDAEAEAIEAGNLAASPASHPLNPPDLSRFDVDRPDLGALLHMAGPYAETRPAQLLNLSIGGARFRVDRPQTPGSRVTLELPAHAIRLDGSILRARGMDAAMIFDPSCRTDPDLSRLLGCRPLTERVRA
jgi:hypothetical protein